VAAASGRIEKSELEALGKLLGSDHGEVVTDVEAALRNLAPRLEAALSVPLASRAQLVQHLAIVALADGGVQNEELAVMEDVATRLQVDPRIIHQTIHGALHPID
jgi:uncharacterized tellurite resistance protein B-like protein